MKTIKHSLFVMVLAVAGLAVFFSLVPVVYATKPPVEDRVVDLTSRLSDSHGMILTGQPDEGTCFTRVINVVREDWNASKATVPVYTKTKIVSVSTNWQKLEVSQWKDDPALMYTVVIDTGMGKNGGLSGNIRVVYCADGAKAREQIGLGKMPESKEAEVDWAVHDLAYKMDGDGGYFLTYQNAFRLTADGTTLGDIPLLAGTRAVFYLGSDWGDKKVVLGTCEAKPCNISAPSGTTFMEQGYGSWVMVEVSPINGAKQAAGTVIGIKP